MNGTTESRRSITFRLAAVMTTMLVFFAHGLDAAPDVSRTTGVRSAPPAVVRVLPAGPYGESRTFSIVLRAVTKAERVRGLQGFRALLPKEAALFSFDPARPVSFWMASLTYAIDIIYVDSRGVVTEVFPSCQPESEEIFSSHGPVRWVIETAEGSGIRRGDRVRFE